MTGGYGCIGSWVTRELVERGYDVWIFDLKEDTHRLELLLDPEKRSRVHFVAGDVSDLEGVRAAVHGPRAEGACKGRCRRPGSAGAPEPLRGLQGLQGAQRPGVLARSGNHEHRPATLDGLRRGARLRHEERADQGGQGRRGRPPLPHQLAFHLDDSRLQDQLGPIHRTSLHDGIAETCRRFLELRDQGRLDLSDLAGDCTFVGRGVHLVPRRREQGRRQPRGHVPGLGVGAAPLVVAGVAGAAGAVGGKRSLGMGLISILARFRSSVSRFF